MASAYHAVKRPSVASAYPVAVQQLYGASRQEQLVDLAGSVRFELASGAEMLARRQGRTYVMTAPYPSGTRFQVFVTSP